MPGNASALSSARLGGEPHSRPPGRFGHLIAFAHRVIPLLDLPDAKHIEPSTMLRNLAVLIACMLALAAGLPAHADFAWNFLQIICSPDQRRLSLKTGWIEDWEPKNDREARHIGTKYGMFSPASIEAHPFQCKIDGGLVTVSVPNDPEPSPNGYGKYFGNYRVTISRGTHLLYKFIAYSDVNDNPVDHLVLTGPAEIRDCAAPAEPWASDWPLYWPNGGAHPRQWRDCVATKLPAPPP